MTTPREDAIAAGQPCASHREQGFIYSVIGCPRCYPALGARAETPDPWTHPRLGVAALREAETSDPPWFTEPRYSVSDCRRHYADAIAAYLASPETAEALARALHAHFDCDCDQTWGTIELESHRRDAAAILAAMRKDSGGVFPDGTTNHPPIDFDNKSRMIAELVAVEGSVKDLSIRINQILTLLSKDNING